MGGLTILSINYFELNECNGAIMCYEIQTKLSKIFAKIGISSVSVQLHNTGNLPVNFSIRCVKDVLIIKFL